MIERYVATRKNALNVATGFVIGKCYSRHRATELLDFLKEIDARLAKNLDVRI
jgi:hypothetical protein